MAWIDEIKKALKANPGKSVAEVIPIAKKTYAASKQGANSSDVVKQGIATVSNATKKVMGKKKSKRARKSKKAKKVKKTKRSKGKRGGRKSRRRRGKRGGGNCCGAAAAEPVAA